LLKEPDYGAECETYKWCLADDLYKHLRGAGPNRARKDGKWIWQGGIT
jgi:hypothetical protein